jgi:formate-dependent nitrite reductase cytochrome c552 subunit
MMNFNLKSLFLVLSFIPVISFGTDNNDRYLQDTAKYVSPFEKKNELCFQCHAFKKYKYTDKVSGRQEEATMDAGRILNKEKFYNCNHKSFSCTDCHSSEFRTFPHPEELKKEIHFHCLDCHGGDPAFAVFKFEEIDAEYSKSVHFDLEEKGFDCWQCHEPHSYRLTARMSDDLKKTVSYDNAICLDCHADYERFRQFSDRKEINLKKVHKWLPNQSIHFKNVRCVDCHAKPGGNILVAHNVMPAEEAIRDCKKCHTEDPETMSSLIMNKPSVKSSPGPDNEIVLKALAVTGPVRNEYLNKILASVSDVVLALIGIHLLLRLIRK